MNKLQHGKCFVRFLSLVVKYHKTHSLSSLSVRDRCGYTQPFSSGFRPFSHGKLFSRCVTAISRAKFPRGKSPWIHQKEQKKSPWHFPSKRAWVFWSPRQIDQSYSGVWQFDSSGYGMCSTNMPFGKKSEHGWIPCVAVSIMETLLLNSLKIQSWKYRLCFILSCAYFLLNRNCISHSVDGEQAQQAGRYALT